MTQPEPVNAFHNPQPLMPAFWASNGHWRSSQVAVESETGRLTWGELTARMNQVGRGSPHSVSNPAPGSACSWPTISPTWKP